MEPAAQGWDAEALDKKLTNLAQIIKLMHGGQGPDLLGICEVENKPLLDELVARTGLPNLVVAHVDSPDIRSIDTSLIYSSAVFAPDGEPVGHNIHFRHPTRDVFEVPLKVKNNGARLHCFVNHWPSRSQGQFESEPLRIAVAENCAFLVQDVLKFKHMDYVAMADSAQTLKNLNTRFDTNVLLMGDFNDEPYSRSVVQYLLAARDHDQAALSDHGSLYFSQSVNSFNLLDQFMVSRGLLLGKSKLKMLLDSVRVFEAPPMASAQKHRPVAFDKKTKKGYSDHFPIEAEIEIL